MTGEDLPQLVVHTVPTEHIGDPIRRLDHANPLFWWRRGEGLIGLGEALRLEFRGPTRFLDAAAAWRELCSRSDVRDEVQLPGSGLVAFSAFAFDDRSSQVSVLIVPQTIIGRRAGTTWITHIGVNAPPSEDALAPASPLGEEFRIHLKAGLQPEDGYMASVREAIDAINHGTLSKVVMARDLVGHMPAEGDVRYVLNTLALSYSDCWTFSANGLVGASPETLVKVVNGRVASRVLAGSIARGQTAMSDQDATIALASSPKELREHEFAVRSVIEVLAPHTLQIAASDIPFALKLPNLWHLASDIDGFLRPGNNILSLVNELHPTGAVAGTPREAAIEFIHEHEPFDRGYYAGPVGWLDAEGDGEFAVALRCAHVDTHGTINAWAGCGIVSGSSPEAELAETKLKFRPIREAFA